MQDHLLIYLRALKYMNISNSCGEESWKICPNMETNTFTVAKKQGCPEYHLCKKSKSTPPPAQKKKLPKQTGQFFLDFVSHAKFLNDQFSAIIIDIVKAYICHFLDRTAHFK